MAHIHLVVSCSKRKTKTPQRSLRLRAVRRSLPVMQRAIEWVDRLQKHSSVLIPACGLYSGEHWHTVRSILDLPVQAEQSVRIWVCSAGYGLLPIETPLTPYSATFTPEDEDAVCDSSDLRDSLPAWWATIAAFDGVHSGPRTIADLARKFKNDFLFVALPHNYLTAVADDLRATAKVVRIPEHFAVLSVGGSVPIEVEPNFLPTEARLQSVAGGSLSSLNARLARLLIAQHRSKPMSLAWCRNKLTGLLKIAPEIIAASRTKLTDAEVKAAIRQYLKVDRTASATRLLRQLRESGRACEHSRFVSLYRQLTGGENDRS